MPLKGLCLDGAQSLFVAEIQSREETSFSFCLFKFVSRLLQRRHRRRRRLYVTFLQGDTAGEKNNLHTHSITLGFSRRSQSEDADSARRSLSTDAATHDRKCQPSALCIASNSSHLSLSSDTVFMDPPRAVRFLLD